MSAFLPQLVRAATTGAAMETGRGIARRNGLGFAQSSSGGGYDDWGDYDYFFDDFGNYWEWDWFDVNHGGGGDYYWPSFEPITLPDLTAPNSPLANDYRYGYDWNQYWNDFFAGNIDRVDTYAHGNRDANASGGGIPDWLPPIGPGPAQRDPYSDLQQTLDWWASISSSPTLPKPCYGQTYHPYPIGHPQQDLCVPYPPNDPNAKKRAEAQKKTQQAAMNAAKKIQQAADKGCPKDPQSRPVWKNPQTGKCELVPPCTAPAKFDSTTRRCLTPAEAKELYGDNNWLMWLLIAAGVLVVVKSGGNSGGGRRR